MEFKRLVGTDPLTVQMRQFLSWLAVSHYSEMTVETREQHLACFRTWLHERDIQTAPQVNRKLLQQYRRYLFQKQKADGTTLQATTQVYYLSAVRMFFSWLVRQNLLLANPAADLELPRTGSRLPRRTLTPAEVERLLAQPDLSTWRGIRDRAILETFYSTGLRRLELVRLNVADVHLDKGLVLVRQGKGGRQRVVPLGQRARSWIEKYLNEVRPVQLRQESGQTLFLSDKGVAFNPDVLTNSLSRYMDRLGFEGSCHQLRHAMATAMLENGADIRYIQMMLGHASLDTTQVYTRVSIVKLKEVHSRTHPARLRKDRE